MFQRGLRATTPQRTPLLAISPATVTNDPDVGDNMWTKNNQKSIRRCNIAAGLLHGVSFIAALTLTIIFLDQSISTELRTDYKIYDANATLSTGGTQPDSSGPFSVLCASLGFYKLSWVNIAFPLITSLFHLVIAFNPEINRRYSKYVLRDGINPYRWIEYSITASIMAWVIGQLSGITNVFLLVVLILVNVAMQYQGYIQEVVNVGRKRADGFFYSPIVIGFVLFAAQWLPIFVYFFAAITSDRPATAEQVPWFVYSIILGLFFQFAAFGLVMVFHYTGSPKWFKSHYNNEVAYIVLSFTSKVFLDWNLLIGILTNPMSA